jgi:hypothetical protein
MEIALNIADQSKALNFLTFIKDLGYITIESAQKLPSRATNAYASGDDAFGIWKDSDISLASVREKAWRRN